MNTTTSPTRLLLVLGGVAAAGLALFMATRLGLAGGTAETSAAPTPPAESTPPPQPQPDPAKPARIELLPGLPAPLARSLQSERVVVVSLYAAPAAGDSPAVREARRGALAAGAGFVALDVFTERRARSLDSFAGTADSPAVLVVRRPGKIVTRLGGVVESSLVAQAAQNAGSGR